MKRALKLLLLLMLSSCASLLTPEKHMVSFTSLPTKTKVYIDNVEMGNTPLDIKLKPTKKPYSIKFEKEGYKTINKELITYVDKTWIILNIFTPYLAGILVDAISGDWRKFDEYTIHQKLESVNPKLNIVPENKVVKLDQFEKFQNNEIKINLAHYFLALNTEHNFFSIDYQKILSNTTAIGFSLGGRFNFNSTWDVIDDFPSLPDLPDINFMPYYRTYYYSNLKAQGTFTEISGFMSYYRYKYIDNGVDKGIKKSFGVGFSVAAGYKYVSKDNFLAELTLGIGINSQYVFHPRMGILIGKRF